MMAAPAAWLTEFGFMGQAAAFKPSSRVGVTSRQLARPADGAWFAGSRPASCGMFALLDMQGGAMKRD